MPSSHPAITDTASQHGMARLSDRQTDKNRRENGGKSKDGGLEAAGLCGVFGKWRALGGREETAPLFTLPHITPLCRLQNMHQCSQRTAAMCSHTINRPGGNEQAAHTHTSTDTYPFIFTCRFHSASHCSLPPSHPSIHPP